MAQAGEWRCHKRGPGAGTGADGVLTGTTEKRESQEPEEKASGVSLGACSLPWTPAATARIKVMATKKTAVATASADVCRSESAGTGGPHSTNSQSCESPLMNPKPQKGVTRE